MYEVDVFHMLIIQICQRREQQLQQEQRVDLYNVVRDWEARERKRDLYPCPITTSTHFLLRNVGLLQYYEEAASMKGHSESLVQLIRRWDVYRQHFVSVLINGTIPLRRICILSLGYLGEGRIFPSFLMSQWVL
jgi:hypothetical protein